MPRRIALLIGNGKIRDASGKGYRITIPGIEHDLAAMAEVLGDAECAGFDVRQLFEPTLIEARREIARVTEGLAAEDRLLIYYSGTSTVGPDGQLYLPVRDSDSQYLAATCIDGDFVLGCLRQCGSRQQVLIMDGCHSGAFFAQNRGVPNGFCAIMSCAADEFCYGDAQGGFFTRALVEGLRGARADRRGNGVVSSEDLFRFVLPRMRAMEPPSTPQYWSWNLAEPVPLLRVRQRVFVSYRRANAEVADAVVARLEAASYGVWIDRSDIPGGVRWRDEIETALIAADCVLFLLSGTALQSDEVYRELARAVTLGKPIVPLRLDATPLTGWYQEQLGGINHIDYRTDDDAWWGKLSVALQTLRRVCLKRAAQDDAAPAAG